MNVLIAFPAGNALNPYSGAETRIFITIQELLKNNFNISVLHSIKSKGFENQTLKKKCDVFYCKDINIFSKSFLFLTDFNPFYFKKIHEILKSKRIDVIQIERPWGFFILKLLAKKNTYLIHDSHLVEGEYINTLVEELKISNFFRPIINIYTKLYEKLVVKLANININLTEKDRDYFIKNYKIKRNKTILIQTPSILEDQNNLKTNNLKIICRKNLNLPLDKTIVIFHGGFSHKPNIMAAKLIESYIAPKINNKNIIFVLAGYNIEKFEKENVICLGFVKDLKILLHAADMAVVPIISGDGMRTKCMDYIMAGLPFVITEAAIKGINFITPGEDFLVYKDIDENFLNGINKLYSDKELRERMSKSLLKKSQLFNRNVFKKYLIKLYSKIPIRKVNQK